MRRFIHLRFLAGIGVGLVVLYALAGFVLLPYLITAYGVPAVSEQLRHPVILREAAFNPFALALRLKGLEIQDTDRTPIIGLEELVVDLRATTLFGQKLGFDEIRLVMPFVAAKVSREGKLNILALVPPSDDAAATAPAGPAQGESKKMMPVDIGLLEINRGIVEYRDESKPNRVSVDVVPVHIALRNFSTIQGSDNAYAFTAEIGKGESLFWEGTVSLEPLESDGKLSISGLQIQTLYQAVQDRFQFDVQEGEIKLSASYHVDMRGQAPRVTVENGRLAVRDLAIGERGFPNPLVKIPAFDVEGVRFSLEEQSIEIGAIRSADAHVEAWMSSGGVVNLQKLFAPAAANGSLPAKPAKTAAEGDSSAKPWTVSVGALELRNYGAMFEDRTTARPEYVDVENVNLKVKDIRIPFKQPMPVDLSLTLNETGSVAARGQVSVEPMSAVVDVTLTDIGIRPFQAYLDRFLNMDVQDGAVNLSGTVRYGRVRSKDSLLQFQGHAGIDRLSVSDRKEFEEVLSWKSLAVNGLALDVEPTAVKISEIIWEEPAVQAVIESDGTLNLSKLVVSSSADETQARPSETDARQVKTRSAPPTITVDQVKLLKAAATFRDVSIQPSVKTGITDLSGTVRGLSSTQIKKADVDLAGRVDKAAPLKIAGKINPLSEDAFTDVVIRLGGMDLTPAGPYSGKYAGYGLSKGKLSLDLKYKISQKLLEAENLVAIDQLTFGQKVESPDATDLPVPLLVALLQDRKGLIEIDLPIRGDLNDPDFKYGKVVVSALFNLLGKIVASPFTLLGALVPDGGSSDDLQFVAFQPGSASLLPDESAKLEMLEKALIERAGLRLDIKGIADTVRDRAVLRAQKLTKQLVAMRREEFRLTSNAEELSAEDEQRLVAKLFAALQVKQADAQGKAREPGEQQPPTPEQMKQRVMAEIPVSDAELESLARQRGEAVRDRLLESGKLEHERVFVLESSIAESDHEHVRTQLGLAVGS
jgi:hypothetical protein